jgi:hypothetical protein
MTISEKELSAILNTHRAMDRALSIPVKISHEEALRIVTSDLIGKYRHCWMNGETEYTAAFEKVLRYYLDDEEMEQIHPGAKTR